MSMFVTAAAVFHSQGLTEVGDDLSQVYDELGAYLGGSSSVLFGVALLASGSPRRAWARSPGRS